MDREEHLKHPVRAVDADVSQARIGHGKWRICTGARENLPRELRLCLHCDLRVVESVMHSLCVCPLNNDLRADMVTKLRAHISVGLQLTLALPEENPDIWMQVLLQGHPEELGADFQMSLRALSAVAAHADIGEGAPLSPVRQFAAETKQQLQSVALDDRRALSSVGQRFVYNVVRRRLALQRQLEDPEARPNRRSRRVAGARPRKPRGADGLRP